MVRRSKKQTQVEKIWLEVDKIWERVREIEDKIYLDKSVQIVDAFGEKVDKNDYIYPHFPYCDKNGS